METDDFIKLLKEIEKESVSQFDTLKSLNMDKEIIELHASFSGKKISNEQKAMLSAVITMQRQLINTFRNTLIELHKRGFFRE